MIHTSPTPTSMPCGQSSTPPMCTACPRQHAQQIREGHPGGPACGELAASSVISSDTARQVDLAQTVAMLASVVGVERAVASAQRNLPTTVVASIAPFLQSSILPSPRAGVTKQAPGPARCAGGEYSRKPLACRRWRCTRFSIKTIATVAVGVIALIVLFGSLNFADLRRSILAANPWWMLVAFLFSLGTYVGAALTLKA